MIDVEASTANSSRAIFAQRKPSQDEVANMLRFYFEAERKIMDYLIVFVMAAMVALYAFIVADVRRRVSFEDPTGLTEPE
jgi:hypothetical protein